MTTIAYCNGTMAADTGVTNLDGLRVSDTTKLHSMGHGWWLGFAGDLGLCSLLREALYGMVQEDPQVLIGDMSDHMGNQNGDPDFIAILAHYTRGLYTIHILSSGSIVAVPLDASRPYAIGKGEAVALGAMLAGATSYKAVEIAREMGVAHGSIDHITLKEAK